MVKFIMDDNTEHSVPGDTVRLRVSDNMVFVNDVFVGNNIKEVKYTDEDEHIIND